MSIRVTRADARRHGLEGRIAFPKPEKKPKASPKPIQRTPLKRRSKPLRRLSDKARKRIREWTGLRAAVLARDRGVCLFCDQPHATTAHHVIPHNPKDGGLDVETNLASIYQGPGFHNSCHAAAHNDLRASKALLLQKLAVLYACTTLLEGETWSAVVSVPVREFDERRAKILPQTFATKEHAVRAALAWTQREIDAGRRRSLLIPIDAPSTGEVQGTQEVTHGNQDDRHDHPDRP